MSKKSSDVSVIFEINKAVELIVAAFKRGNKLLIFGNGGSAAMAQHMASELVWRFKKESKALPAIALMDVAIMTAIANDAHYSKVFSRQIEALGVEGDVALGLTTSGASSNIRQAIFRAKEMGLHTILLNACEDDLLAEIDFDFISSDTAKVQEVHLKIIHRMCDMIEREFD